MKKKSSVQKNFSVKDQSFERKYFSIGNHFSVRKRFSFGKDHFALLLTAIMVLSLLTACNAAKPVKETRSTSSAEKSNPAPPVKVVLNEVAHSIFYAPMYAAIENGYFEEEGIDLELVCGFGADKTMTAVLSGEADIGFMGSEASIYAYNEGASDYVVNFAQLTQRAGNFLVAREKMPDFQWTDLKGSNVLGGRKGVASIVM